MLLEASACCSHQFDLSLPTRAGHLSPTFSHRWVLWGPCLLLYIAPFYSKAS